MANSDWSLISIEPTKPRHFRQVRDLTADEWRDYEAQVKYLRAVAHSRTLLRSLLAAHSTFERHVVHLRGPELERLHSRPMEDWLGPLNHNFDAVLIAMRRYLDQTKSRLEHGGATWSGGPTLSDSLKVFEKERQAAFDRSIPYRITYKMRDYVQHGRPALSATRVTGHWDPQTRTGSHELKVACSRDSLLAPGFDWGKWALSDLQAMPPEIEIMPILDAAVGQYLSIDREVFRSYEPGIKAAIAGIEGLLAQACGDASRATVGQMREGPRHQSGNRTFTLTLAEPPDRISWP